MNTDRWKDFGADERALIAHGLTEVALVDMLAAQRGILTAIEGSSPYKDDLKQLYMASKMVHEISVTLGVDSNFTDTLDRLSILIEHAED